MFAKIVALSTQRYGKPKLDEIAFDYATLDPDSFEKSNDVELDELGKSKINELGLILEGTKMAFTIRMNSINDRILIRSEHVSDFFFIKTVVIANGHFTKASMRIVSCISLRDQLKIEATQQGKYVYIEAILMKNNVEVAQLIMPNESPMTEISFAENIKFISKSAINVLVDALKDQQHDVAKMFLANADMFCI